MADKEQIIKEKVEHAGLMDFAGLYSYAHNWFKEEGYSVDETKYSEKSDGTKRGIDIEWKITKTLSDYFKFDNKLKFEVTDLTDVEVEIDGKKKKMNQGKVTMEITGNLIKDPDSKWQTTPFNRFIRDVYNKYVIPGRTHDMRGLLTSDIQKFKETMKAYLELLGRR